MEDPDVAALRAQWLNELDAQALAADEREMVAEWAVEARTARDDLAGDVRAFMGASRREVRQEFDDFRHGAFFDLIRARSQGIELTGRQLRQAVRFWYEVSGGQIGVAHAWWTAGISPLDMRVEELVALGLSPQDLSTVVQGKTVLQHFRERVDLTPLVDEIRKAGRTRGRRSA